MILIGHKDTGKVVLKIDTDTGKAIAVAQTADGSLWREIACKKCDLGFQSLCGAVFEQVTLEAAVFRSADLTDAYFNRCMLAGARFDGAMLETALFYQCDLQRCDFELAMCSGAQFMQCDMRAAKIGGAELWGAYFDENVLDAAWTMPTDPRTAFVLLALRMPLPCDITRELLCNTRFCWNDAAKLAISNRKVLMGIRKVWPALYVRIVRRVKMLREDEKKAKRRENK